MCAVLLDVTEAFCGNVDENTESELRNEDVSLLEVRMATYLPGRIELCCTGTV